MTFGSGAPFDPYFFVTPQSNTTWNANPDGFTQVDPRLVPGENTAFFVTAGQSNGVGASFSASAYTPTNTAKNQTMNIFTGGIYQTKDPLIGSAGAQTGGSIGGRLADKLITAGIFARVILAPCEVGSTTIADWQPGGVLFDKIISATRRGKSLGIPVTAYLWGNGETDGANGTTQSAYAAGLTSLIAAVRAYGADFQAPWFISQQSLGANVAHSAITAAQASVVNNTTIYTGATGLDSLTGATYRQGDNTHTTATGADAFATAWKTALDAVF